MFFHDDQIPTIIDLESLSLSLSLFFSFISLLYLEKEANPTSILLYISPPTRKSHFYTSLSLPAIL
jgi:hypothetical protein